MKTKGGKGRTLGGGRSSSDLTHIRKPEHLVGVRGTTVDGHSSDKVRKSCTGQKGGDS